MSEGFDVLAAIQSGFKVSSKLCLNLGSHKRIRPRFSLATNFIPIF